MLPNKMFGSMVFIQSVYVQGTEPSQPASLRSGQVQQMRSDTGGINIPAPVNYVQSLTSSTIPTLSELELRQDYRDLGEALSEMTRLDADIEWKIEPAVFEAAKFVASQLVAASVPAPQIFNHGSRSIVFNWSNSRDNLYLTISADKVSALISSPSKIKRRLELSGLNIAASKLLVLGFQSPGGNEAVLLADIANSSPEFAS